MKAGDLSFSVALYTITAITGIAILMARRYLPFMGKAELGGPTFYRWLTFTLLILDDDMAMGRAQEYGALYNQLTIETAQRTLRFWRIRRDTGDVAA